MELAISGPFLCDFLLVQLFWLSLSLMKIIKYSCETLKKNKEVYAKAIVYFMESEIRFKALRCFHLFSEEIDFFVAYETQKSSFQIDDS